MAVNKRLLQGAAAAGGLVPSEHFGVVLYEGDGAAGHSINGGKFGAGAYFNGENSNTSGIVLTNLNDLLAGSDFSISLWVNCSTTQSGDSGEATIIGSAGSSSTNGFDIMLKPTTGYLFFNFGNPNNDTASTTDLRDGNWHHIVFTYTSSQALLYLDGSLLLTENSPNSLSSIPNEITLGKWSTGSYYALTGKIDQLRIFQKVLSSTQVSTLYAETAATVESLSPLGNETVDTLQVLGDSSCIATYRFENDEVDLSGNYDGTGTEIQYAAGRYGQAADFNGSSSKILYPQAAPFNDSNTILAISAWVKLNSASDEFVIMSASSTSDSNDHMALILGGSRAGRFFIRDASGSDELQANFGSTNDTNWNHYVWQLSATNGIELWVNGVSQTRTVTVQTGGMTTSSWFSDIDYATGVQYATGINRVVSTAYYAGEVDQMRLFNKEVSAAEVTTLYNENPLVASYRFEGNANDDMRTYDGTATNVTYEYGLGFTPDFVWIKDRSATRDHNITDSTRGVTHPIYIETGAELTNSTFVTSFDTGGFTLGNNATANESGEDFVAWCLKANGGTTSSNTDGTVTSTVQANQDAGFSIVQYDGTGAAATIGHGLSSAAPELIITKQRTGTTSWSVGVLDWTKYLELDDTPAFRTASSVWNNTAPTSTVFSVAGSGGSNTSGGTNIAYCFHSVEGFSKIGSYTGTGVTKSIETGFEPAFLLSKRVSSTSDWYIIDNKRNTTNPRNNFINANTSDAEYNPSYGVNFNSNGFSLISTDLNGTGQEWIYMAFAADPDTEAPTVAKSFNAVTYTGNGGTQSITGLGFKPNMTWIKHRNEANDHVLTDSIRGTGLIYPNGNDAQNQDSQLTSFDSDGFSLAYATGQNVKFNKSGGTYVAWSWKADDNEPTINTEGSIDSLVSANANAGFSIVKYEGDGSTSKTVGHGLSSAPEIVIVKRLDSSADWYVWATPVMSITGSTSDYIVLNSSAAKVTAASVTNLWGGNVPSATTIGVGDSSGSNASGGEYIAYCFHSVSGYSKIGSYTGNGSTNAITGLGFQPDWVLIKETTAAESWRVFDSVRGATERLFPDTSGTESTASDSLTSFDSNGFSLGSSAGVNQSGQTYIYMAFKIN